MRTILCLLVLSASIRGDEPAKPTVAEQAEIKKLLTQTKDYEPNNREKACVLLASYGAKAKEAVPRLKEMIEQDLNGSARVAALSTLCEIDLKAAKPVLNKEALGSALPAVRVLALQLLAKHEPKEKSSLATAKAAMKDRNTDVVCAACLTLAMHKLRTEDELELTADILAKLANGKQPENAQQTIFRIQAIKMLDPKKPSFLALHKYRQLTTMYDKISVKTTLEPFDDFIKTHRMAVAADMLLVLTRKGDDPFDKSCFDTIDAVLKQADLPKVYEGFASLDLKTSDEAKLKVVLDRLITTGTKGLEGPLQAAVKTPTLPMSKIFLAIASQRGLGSLISEEDVLKLIQSADAGLNDYGLRFALGKHSVLLTTTALAKVFPANSGNANLLAAVYRDYATSLSEKKEPSASTVTLLKSTWTHANEDVRGIGVATSARIGLLTKIPVEELRPLLIDKNQRVLGYAFSALADRSKTDATAKMLLDELAESKDEDVKLFAKLARAGTLKIDATPTASWLIDEDTTAIVDVKVRSILDFLPIKKRLNKKVVAELKQSTLLRQFEFDPLTELFSAQFAISETKDSTALVTGDFKRERRRTPLLIEGGNDSYAQFLNDSTLIVATTKPKLEEIANREFKPLKLVADKQPLLTAIPAKPTGSVIWVASRWPSVLIDGSMLRSIGIDAVSPALLKTSPFFLITLDIEKSDVVFRWTVPSANVEDQDAWKAYLEKWVDAYKTFAPLLGGYTPGLKLLIEDSTKSIGVQIEDKKAVVLSFRISMNAMDTALDVLVPGEDK